eukprot:GHRQ01012151.1.p1 GENE.GHRQ01012151.1~~GHRQ01012151.1.p1  ORF type:complete len:176 (+),score=69.82 GHRQ01012151.1:92-619(+)
MQLCNQKTAVHVAGASRASRAQRSVCRPMAAAATEPVTASTTAAEPLMMRALRGDAVERPPVWMMRQAGRYMKVYQDLCKKHTTFRERSENVDLAVEVSLQPWLAFKPDGVILFSDILTPLPGMNIPFDITAGKGPVIAEPIRTMEVSSRAGGTWLCVAAAAAAAAVAASASPWR